MGEVERTRFVDGTGRREDFTDRIAAWKRRGELGRLLDQLADHV